MTTVFKAYYHGTLSELKSHLRSASNDEVEEALGDIFDWEELTNTGFWETMTEADFQKVLEKFGFIMDCGVNPFHEQIVGEFTHCIEGHRFALFIGRYMIAKVDSLDEAERRVIEAYSDAEDDDLKVHWMANLKFLFAEKEQVKLRDALPKTKKKKSKRIEVRL